MPGGDKTGPSGMGPMTGKRMGYCVGFDHPGYIDQNLNFRNFGGGYGRGGNRRRWFSYGNSPVENIPVASEKTLIANEINVLKDQLFSLEKRLSEINKGDDKNE